MSTATAELSGGYATVASITQAHTALLTRALATESNYREGVTARVSVVKTLSLKQQTVNGVSYRFEVLAFPVSSANALAAPADVAHEALYAIDIYEPRDGSLQVTGIDLLSKVHIVTKSEAHTIGSIKVLPTVVTTRVETTTVGGYETVSTVTEEHTARLTKALETETSYAEGVTVRVSVLEVRSVKQQVVSGMNYRYEVVAAPVSRANDGTTTVDSSHPAMYEIQIYEQAWTNTLQVTGITLLSTGGVHTSTTTKKHTALVPVKHTVLSPVKHVTKTTTTTTRVASGGSAGTAGGDAATTTTASVSRFAVVGDDESTGKHAGSSPAPLAPVPATKRTPTSFLCSIDALFF